jgi:hypothetical protein
MAAPKFVWFESFFGNTDVRTRVKHQLAPSITVAKGDPLTIGANGKLALSTVAQVVDYIAAEGATSTATSITTIGVISTGKGFGVWKALLNLITGATDPFCTGAGSTTTAVFLTAGGSSNDMIGGVVYFPLTGEVRKITANTYSSTTATITWIEPVAVATSTTTVLRVSVLGVGDKAIQLSATGGNAGGALIGDKTGGKLTCYELDIINSTGYFTFNMT